MSDFSIEVCAPVVERLLKVGARIHQKFTCSSCGSRQTINTPDVLFTSGKCEECGEITDITKSGCNYLVMAHGSKMQAEVFKILKGM